MTIRLGERTAFCIIGDQAVCLDVGRDRYFCLRGEANAALVVLASGGTMSDRQEVALHALERRGILRGVRAAGATEQVLPARRSILDEPPTTPSPCVYAGWVAATARTMVTMHRGFERSLANAHASRVAAKGALSHDRRLVHQVACAHDRAAPLLRSHDRCLPRSLALFDQLIRLRQDATLIIGVALEPFRAHSWVQEDDVVLNDTLDAVRVFTPILTL